MFCYPHGQTADFGQREIGCLRSTGFAGAVTTMPGYATIASTAHPTNLYRVPRFAYSDSVRTVLSDVSALEWLMTRSTIRS